MNCLHFFMILPLVALAQEFPTPQEISFILFSDMDIDTNLEIHRVDLDYYFNKYDADSNSRVSSFEFDDYIGFHYYYISIYDNQLFESLDFNNDGYLDKNDYSVLWFLLDTNNNDVVSETEFVFYFSDLFRSFEYGRPR